MAQSFSNVQDSTLWNIVDCSILTRSHYPRLIVIRHLKHGGEIKIATETRCTRPMNFMGLLSCDYWRDGP